MRIVVLRFSSLGDIILTTSALRYLREKYPTAKIDFVTKKEFHGVLLNNTVIDHCYLFEGQAIRDLAEEVQKAGDIDILLDLHNSVRSRWLRFNIKATTRLVYRKPYIKRWLLVFLKLNFFKNPRHISEQYTLPLKKLGIEPAYRLPEVSVQEPAGSVLELTSKNAYIALGIGAKWFTKRWPVAQFARLIELLHEAYPERNVILLGSEAEKPLVDELLIKVNPSTGLEIHDMTGQLSIQETAFIIKHAALLISNDSALVHIASAFETRMIALFRSTVPEFGFAPVHAKSIVLSEPVNCKPCNHKGLANCPKKHFACAYLLSPDKVFKAVQKLLP